MRLLLALALAACNPVQTVKGLGGDVVDVIGPLCDVVNYNCDGRVFVCDATDPAGETTSAELCWMDDSSTELAGAITSTGYYDVTCKPTPRGGALGWPCHYQCPGAKGCNAYQGCYCE